MRHEEGKTSEGARDQIRLPAYAASGPPPPPRGRLPRSSMSRSSAHPAVIVLVICAIALPVLIGIVGIFAAILVPAVFRAREVEGTAACQQNLKQMGIILEIYSLEDAGSLYPPMSELIRIEPDSLYPDYMTNLDILRCPQDEGADPLGTDPDDPDVFRDAFNDSSYFYLGYRVRNEEEARVFVEACQAAKRSDAPFETALTEILATGPTPLPRLGATCAPEEEQGEIPVMFDLYPVHVHDSIAVLYLDGHVSRECLGSGFPPRNGSSTSCICWPRPVERGGHAPLRSARNQPTLREVHWAKPRHRMGETEG